MARFSCAVNARASRFIQAIISTRPVLWSWAIAGTRQSAFQLIPSSQFIGFSAQWAKYASLHQRWLSAHHDEDAGYQHHPRRPGGYGVPAVGAGRQRRARWEEHTSEIKSLMRISSDL